MDIQKIRLDFPILSRKVNGNQLIYFDNAATTQKPRQVTDAITDYYNNHNANVHRAVHTLSMEATKAYEESREKISNFISARNLSEIVFVRGTTEAINLVAYSWGLSNLNKDDEVLLSLMEHHSNIVPWEIIRKHKGFTINYAKIKQDATLDFEDFESKLSKKTKIVCLNHVSNITGTINDVKRLAKVAHENGSIVLVDGAQAVPHMKIDVQELDVDFYAFSGHKMLGPTGIGVLYGKKELLENMPPFQGGGEMIKEVSYNKNKCEVSWSELPGKFEAGTPNICGVIGLGAAIEYLKGIGMEEVYEHEKELTEYTVKHMKECDKIKLYGTNDLSQRCGIIPFGVRDISAHDVALLCDNYGIMIRSGYHCAQPLHEILKLKSSARASFYIYNTREEVDRFIEVLKAFN